jgi:hypothetical protein
MLSGANLNIRRYTSIEFQESTMRCPPMNCSVKGQQRAASKRVKPTAFGAGMPALWFLEGVVPESAAAYPQRW